MFDVLSLCCVSLRTHTPTPKAEEGEWWHSAFSLLLFPHHVMHKAINMAARTKEKEEEKRVV